MRAPAVGTVGSLKREPANSAMLGTVKIDVQQNKHGGSVWRGSR